MWFDYLTPFPGVESNGTFRATPTFRASGPEEPARDLPASGLVVRPQVQATWGVPALVFGALLVNVFLD